MAGPAAKEIQTNPDWHLQRFDWLQRKALILRLSREHYAQASFLDQTMEREAKEGYWYELHQLDQLFPSSEALPERLGLIFHIGHCGSTLISRVLGQLQNTLVLREPLTLRFLADCKRELGFSLALMDETDWMRLLRQVLLTHGRIYLDRDLPIIKASSICNHLALDILGMHSGCRVLLIHIPLETYLASMLKSPNLLVDVRGFAKQRLQDFLRLRPESKLILHELSDWQLMVLSWITGMVDLIHANRQFPEQTLMMNFDQWLESGGVEELADFFQTGRENLQAGRILQRELGRYAKKTDHPYSPAQRSHGLNQSRQINGDLIRQAMEWARELHGKYRLDEISSYLD